MRNPIQYALATIGALLVLSTASQAQSNPPLFNATQSYKIGDLVTYSGVTFQCLINETTTHPNPHQPPYWGVYNVYAGALIMPVGPSEPLKTITAAWAYIANAHIATNSYIELKLDSNYQEFFSSSFSLDHPYGSKILIVGTNAGQEAIFHGTGGFTLDSGHTLADLEGLTVFGQTGTSNGAPAIKVTQNACLAKLQNITIENFDVGLDAESSGTIDNVGSLSLAQFINGGAEASSNATINFKSAVTFDGSNSSAIPAFGFWASGATISCPGCTANNCVNCFEATNGGKMEASNAITATTTKLVYCIGYYATDRSYIDAYKASDSGNEFGFHCENASFINAQSSYCVNNIYFDFDVDQCGSIDVSGNTVAGGGVAGIGTNDGSYIFGFNGTSRDRPRVKPR